MTLSYQEGSERNNLGNCALEVSHYECVNLSPSFKVTSFGKKSSLYLSRHKKELRFSFPFFLSFLPSFLFLRDLIFDNFNGSF